MLTILGTCIVCVALVAGFNGGRRRWRRAPLLRFDSEDARMMTIAERQLAAVKADGVLFSCSRVMNHGEAAIFAAARRITGQPMPTGDFPFHVFVQVALGEVIRTAPATPWNRWAADQAYKAINAKRTDLLITDRYGMPVLAIEYQGSGHYLGATAAKRDEIKRVALGRAGVRYVEIPAGLSRDELTRVVREAMESVREPLPAWCG